MHPLRRRRSRTHHRLFLARGGWRPHRHSGAIPLAFIRNQFQYCSLICPFAVEGAITVPVAAVQAPVTFLGSLASTGSPLKAVGVARRRSPARLTPRPHRCSTTIFSWWCRKHFTPSTSRLSKHSTSLPRSSRLVNFCRRSRTAHQHSRRPRSGSRAADHPDGRQNILQVVAVEAVNVTTAVAFPAGELLLLAWCRPRTPPHRNSLIRDPVVRWRPGPRRRARSQRGGAHVTSPWTPR